MFSTIHSYAPNVAFLLAINMNPSISCHSKQQHFTAHKLLISNKFILHNFSIPLSVPPSVDIGGLAPSAPECKPHALCPVIKVCKINSLCVVQRWRFFQNDETFSGIFGEWKWKRCGIKYPSTVQNLLVHIFSHEIGKFPFFLEISRPLFRGFFRPTDWYFKLTGSKPLAQFL